MLSLKQLIDGHFQRLYLLPVLVLKLALILFCLLATYLGISEYKEALLYERTQNVNEHLFIQAQEFNHHLLSVRRQAESLQYQHQRHFQTAPKPYSKEDAAPFVLADNGTFIKQAGSSGSSIFITRSHAQNTQTQAKAIHTEYWDTQLQYTVEQSPLIVAAYFNSYDNFTRYYPFIEGIDTLFDPEMYLEDFSFYYLANQRHNKERTVQWTPAYLDPAGQGWLVSAIAPIYHHNFLEGVTGLDIPLKALVHEVEQFSLPFGGELFLADEQGRILAMSAGTKRLLNLHSTPQPQSSEQYNTLWPDEFLIQKLPYSSFRQSIIEMIEQEQRSLFVEHDFSNYQLASQPITETGWTLFRVTPAEQVLASMHELEQTTYTLLFMAIGIMLLCYLVFYGVANHYSGRLADQITRPLDRVMIPASEQSDSDKKIIAGIHEFAQLAEQIEQHAQEQATGSSAKAAHQPNSEWPSSGAEQPANNALEEAYLLNRPSFVRTGDQVLEASLKLEQPVTLIQFEISEYAELVRHYGQQAADELLRQCADCTEKIMPEHALLAHISAAQYAILLPNMDEQQSLLAARRLRSELFLAVELGRSSSISIQLSVVEAQPSHYESTQLMLERSHQLLERNRGNRQNLIQTQEGSME